MSTISISVFLCLPDDIRWLKSAGMEQQDVNYRKIWTGMRIEPTRQSRPAKKPTPYRVPSPPMGHPSSPVFSRPHLRIELTSINYFINTIMNWRETEFLVISGFYEHPGTYDLRTGSSFRRRHRVYQHPPRM